MTPASDKVIRLRHLLRARFGDGRPGAAGEVFPTGLPALDDVGVPRAAVTEIVARPEAGPGGGLLCLGLLHAAGRKGERVVLIDAKSSFSPQGLPQEELRRLLWVRCREAWSAIKAADLVVRDGNVPLVIMLLTVCPEAELRRLPATAWHRLQMLAEQTAVTLLVFTPRPQVGCARLRLAVGGAFPLEKLHICRHHLESALELRVEKRRSAAGRRTDEELRRAQCA